MNLGFGTASLLAIGLRDGAAVPLEILVRWELPRRTRNCGLRFNGKPEMVVAYFQALAEEVRKKMAELGVGDRWENCAAGTTAWEHGRDGRVFGGANFGDAARGRPQQVPTDHFGAGGFATLQQCDCLAIRGAADSTIRIASVGTGLSGEIMRRRAQDRGAVHGNEQRIHAGVYGVGGAEFRGILGGRRHLEIGWGSERLRRQRAFWRNDCDFGGIGGFAARRCAGRETPCCMARLPGSFTSAAARGSGLRFAIVARLAVVEGVGQHGCEYMTVA